MTRTILKWAGGKRQLLPEILPMIPEYSTYCEPFVGGGALLFALQPKNAIINDSNPELMNVYSVVKTDVQPLIDSLKLHENTPEHYYKVRNLDREPGFDKMTNIERASRTIYLNRTCFNGLYRVNRKGQFNTPYGKYSNPDIVNENVLTDAHNLLQNVSMPCGDYANVLHQLPSDSFVYFDPPYDTDSSNFIEYTSDRFDRSEQLRLKQECDKLTERGIKFLMSNSSTEFIRDLYEDYIVRSVDAVRSINCKGNGRGAVKELLISNYIL